MEYGILYNSQYGKKLTVAVRKALEEKVTAGARAGQKKIRV